MSDNYQDFKGQLSDWVKDEADFELYKLRHSTEHIFNQAVEELFPGQILRAMGPAIQDGWYNDSRWEKKPSEDDFAQIEARMQSIIDADLPFVRKDISEIEARELFKDNPFKLEFINEFVAAGSPLTVYYTGEPSNAKFMDLCRGPHIDSTGAIKAFKLLSIAGAYWRGNEKNEMLTRVYGTTFRTQEELDQYLWQQEEAKKRDHKKLAKELDLVVFSELVGAGLPMYTPRGSILRNAVYNYSRELNNKIGYKEVNTPNFNRAELFKVSGHYDKYKDDMLKVVSNYSEEEMYFKPMNCPQHTQLFASQLRSYRDLPYRVADFSNLARDERPGELNGLLRSRVFTQDDGHGFVTEDQIAQEFKNIAGVIKEALQTYGLENYWVRLSLRDPNNTSKYLGDDETWEKAESTLRQLLIDMGVNYKEAPGEAAIYGPKMDFMSFDSLGREWQISTIQIDMNMPGRFGLKYIDQDGQERTPIMIHRAIVGSERFIGIIIEHFGGAFPAWLSPEQVRLVPITDQNFGYAEQVAEKLNAVGIRFEIDKEADRMQNKIRKAQEMKVPYMLIMGKQEAEASTLSVRLRNGTEYKNMPVDEFVQKLVQNIKDKKLEIELN